MDINAEPFKTLLQEYDDCSEVLNECYMDARSKSEHFSKISYERYERTRIRQDRIANILVSKFREQKGVNDGKKS